jgi:heavy metal sensor kinase
MFRSLRAKVVGWQALVLTLTLAGFGVGFFQLVRRAKLREVDAQLENAAQSFSSRLRRYPFRWTAREPSWWNPFSRPSTSSSGNSSGMLDSWAKRFERRNWFELPEGFARRFGEDPELPPYFVIWHPNDDVIARSDPIDEASADVVPEIPSRPAGEDPFYIRQDGPHREIVLDGPKESLILVGASVHREIADLDNLAVLLLGTGVAVILVALTGSWFVAKRAIRPIDEISSIAKSISASNLSRRIDVSSTDSELETLASVLNDTFDRLQESFRKQTRFTADASHELRTPLSVILTHTELARQKERSSEDYRQAIETCFRAATRMKSLVDGLLTLARSDSGDPARTDEVVDLQTIVDDCIDLLNPLAAKRDVELRVELESIRVKARADRVSQVVTNLLSNAIHYNRAGGRIDIVLTAEGSDAVLAVTDTGVGISEADRQEIFERFFRVDEAGSREFGGAGLGLAICAAIVEGLGGSIACDSEVGTGSTFTVKLPRAL